DTLRLLISGSSQLYSVLANVDGKQSLCAAGSKGLYEGATDVNHAISNSIAAIVSTKFVSGWLGAGSPLSGRASK
ncbi:hypothetical protein Tco_0423433, partial [Tanacetum coccineum]